MAHKEHDLIRDTIAKAMAEIGYEVTIESPRVHFIDVIAKPKTLADKESEWHIEVMAKRTTKSSIEMIPHKVLDRERIVMKGGEKRKVVIKDEKDVYDKVSALVKEGEYVEK